ncbi:MAG: putative Transcription antitermination protein RfaH [Deltaproteobacteria bacterium]|nr:putative Transcription antitermination protein RfaH [Deltaproteobacteria bacterium]
MRQWYVIQTKPKKEAEAKSYLSMKGLEIFFPLLESFAQKNGRVNREVKPLFPNYIFGNFDAVEDYTLVKYGKGVNKIVSFGSEPAQVSQLVIEEIRTRIDETGVVRKRFNLTPNDPVRVKSGPFRDFLGIFEKWLPEKERVRILLNLIGYQPQVELHYSLVEKVV